MPKMTGNDIITRVRNAKAALGPKCRKFAGAVTVEILRNALAEASIPTSARDVFVRGIPLEVDLIVPLPGSAKPQFDLLYEPRSVAVALEIKNSGCFGQDSLRRVTSNLKQLRNAGIRCAYVTLEERRGYRWTATSKHLGTRCFTLAWHTATDGPYKTTSDWCALLKYLRKALKG